LPRVSSVEGALISSIVPARFRGLFSGLLPGSLVFGVERLLLVIERAHGGLQLVADVRWPRRAAASSNAKR